MNIKLIILMVIIVVSSISIVVASDLSNDYKFDNKDNADSLTPGHHSLHHSQYDGNAKNDFTIDGYILRFIQNQ